MIDLHMDNDKVADDANNSRYSTPSNQFNVTDKCRLEKESATTPKIASMHTHACIYTHGDKLFPLGESERAV